MPSRSRPLYILSHGIEVYGEHKKGHRTYCWIAPHPLFPNNKPHLPRGTSVAKARVLMTAHLGRPLETNEHVHHKVGYEDVLENLELITAVDHNKLHKTGTHHSEETKRQIAASLRRAYREGRRRDSSFGGIM